MKDNSVLSVSRMSNLIHRRHPRSSTVKRLAVLLGFPLLFAAGFSTVWLNLVHTGVTAKPQLLSRRSAATTASSVCNLLPAAIVTFPQFGRHGQVLSSYTPGDSIWPRSVFYGDYKNFASYMSDVQAAAINTFETGGFLKDPGTSGCTSSDFALSGGTGVCGNWHQSMITQNMNPALSATQTFGMPWLSQTDTINGPNVFTSCSNGTCTPSWGWPALTDYTSTLQQYAQQYGMVVGQISPDEWTTSIATDPNANLLAQGLGLEGTGTPHVIWGADPLEGRTVNMLSSLTSDYPIYELGGNAQFNGIPGWLQDYEVIEGVRNQVVAARGSLPSNIVGGCSGIAYIKRTNDTQYTPGVDTPESNPYGTGGIVDEVMYAVAHGFTGFRNYEFDIIRAQQRANDPICTTNNCALEQTGCSPISAYSGFRGLGQDRWYALAAAYNMVKTVEPYALQPMMTAPANCDSTGNGSGDPIICGAHQGNGGRLVVIINFSTNSNSYTFNPAAYVFAGGSAKSWKIIGSTDGSCGLQTTLPSVGDCGRGPTTINGVTWTQGSVMASPSAAPMSITALNMQPTEVDLFLYHQ
jgi:hypothetical protein